MTAPKSFRASLGQITDEGYWAFKEAHIAMRDIELMSSQVRGALKDAINIVLNTRLVSTNKVSWPKEVLR